MTDISKSISRYSPDQRVAFDRWDSSVNQTPGSELQGLQGTPMTSRGARAASAEPEAKTTARAFETTLTAVACSEATLLSGCAIRRTAQPRATMPPSRVAQPSRVAKPAVVRPGTRVDLASEAMPPIPSAQNHGATRVLWALTLGMSALPKSVTDPPSAPRDERHEKL